MGLNAICTVIKCKNYTHKTFYELPVKPSPNLPNQNSFIFILQSVFLKVQIFHLAGEPHFRSRFMDHPNCLTEDSAFTPESVPGAKNPPLLGIKCYGTDLRDAIKKNIVPKPEINLDWILSAYNDFPEKDKFFTSYFDVLAGGPYLGNRFRKE